MNFTLQDEARTSITNFLQRLERGKQQEHGVRINSVDSGLAEEDLRTVLSGERLPHSIYLPKVETVEHIDWVCFQGKIKAELIFFIIQ